MIKVLLISLFLAWSGAALCAGKTPEAAAERYEGLRPSEWGPRVSGVIYSFKARGKELALTLDACGGRRGSGYDAKLVAYLRRHKIAATLFISARWALSNPAIFAELAQDPLFEIGNHGLTHRPCAVTPRSAYGIKATGSAEATRLEVAGNDKILRRLGAKELHFFRSGTALYDDIAVKIIQDQGYRVAGFTKAADGGAKLSASQVYRNLVSALPGSILLLHFNQPQSGTRKGLVMALDRLRAEGWTFLRLSEALNPNRR